MGELSAFGADWGNYTSSPLRWGIRERGRGRKRVCIAK